MASASRCRSSSRSRDFAAFSGSGGEHRWFLHTGPARGAVAPGIDIKSHAGYVVVPPAEHASGGRYEWTDAGPIALAPDYLRSLLTPPPLRVHTSMGTPSPRAAEALLRVVREAPNGKRRRAADRCRRGQRPVLRRGRGDGAVRHQVPGTGRRCVLMDFTAPDPSDEQISVVSFPALHADALCGLPGKIVEAVAPHTEAHPAAILVQFLARFGVTVGPRPHVFVDNREHPARLWPLIVGKTADGAKGTSYGVVEALFATVERHLAATPTSLRHDPLRRVSGLSSGEGLIELVRDGNGDNPDAKNFDEGIADKRLLVVEQEFTSALAVMERQGSTLPRVVREAWDGDVLRTLTRSAQTATGAHISVIGHVTPASSDCG